MSNIAVGCDHAGFPYKEAVIKIIEELGYSVNDFGTDSADSVDYPDYVHPVAESVENGESEFGVILCGSGNGVAMTANKHQDIRAAVCWNNEITALARQHNNANILAIPARFVSEQQASSMTRIFLKTAFEGGRHKRRVEKISC